MKISRDYHEALRRMGIQNPGDIEVSQPVFTIPLDESVSALATPLQVPVSGGFIAEGAVVGRHSGVRIDARGRGIWLEWLGEIGGTVGIHVYTDVAFDTVTVAVVGDLAPSGAVESIVTQGNQLAANVPPISFRALQTVVIPRFPLWIPAGVSVTAVLQVANLAANISWLFREIPRRGANPDED